MSDAPLLEVKGLEKYFKVAGSRGRQQAILKAVDHIDLEIRAGETLGLVGESGCGKSTFGRTVLNLLPATGGEIYFKGEKIQGKSSREMRNLRQKMQIIFQDPFASLNPRMTIGQLVQAPLDVIRLGTKAERLQKVKAILDFVGIGQQYLGKYPHEMSGGQRQRVVIARAMILNPEFVVCDEPVSALDVSVRSQVLNLMKKMQSQFSLAYLFISHDLSVVKYICDRIAVMYLGKIVEIGSKKDIFERPQHPYTKALLSAIPMPELRKTKERILLKGDIPSPMNPPRGCSFHTRCPFADDKCLSLVPQLKGLADNPEHRVSCFKNKEIDVS